LNMRIGNKNLKIANLDRIRKAVDKIDGKILKLLNLRASKALLIGDEKKKAGLPVVDLKREKQIIERMIKMNNGPLSDEQVARLYKSIISSCRNLQKKIHEGGE